MTPHAVRAGNERSGGLREQRGAALVLVVALATVFVAVAALAVDLAGLRLDRRSNRAAADFAALAAAGALPGDAPAACQQAQAAVQANLRISGAPTWSTGCATFTTTCDPALPRQAVASVGAVQVTITHPVPDGHALMTGTGGTAQSVNPDIDGVPCERMAIQVRSERRYFFAPVMGFESGTSTVHAVGRVRQQPASQLGEAVALLVLDPTRCNALTTSGGGRIIMEESLPDANGHRAPGSIHLDSNASGCPNNGVTVDASSTNSRIHALPSSTSGLPGRIALRALPAGATTCVNKACQQGDVTSTPPRLHPQPVPTSLRIGRAAVDHRYNCKASYSFPANQPWNNHAEHPVPGCSTGGGAHIDFLEASFQHSLPAAAGPWQTWTDCSPNHPVTLHGNWFVNCTNPQNGNMGTLNVSNNFHITGHAVFRANVSATGGEFRIGDGITPRVAYFREGSFSASTSVVLDQVTLFLKNGGISVGGGAALNWQGPTAPTMIGGHVLALQGLALWSESPTHSHSLSGGTLNSVYGVFFAPNAGYSGNNNAFNLSGGSHQPQFRAQFITYRLNVGGGSELRMQSPPIITLPAPPQHRARLIR